MNTKVNEIYIFDESLNLIATIDNYEKIVWQQNLFEADIFSIELNYNPTNDSKNQYYEHFLFTDNYTALSSSFPPKSNLKLKGYVLIFPSQTYSCLYELLFLLSIL